MDTTTFDEWTKADILYFEGLDSTEFRSDILAIYYKTLDHPQLRIDFLELDLSSPLEVRILLDVLPGNNSEITNTNGLKLGWDYDLLINQENGLCSDLSSISKPEDIPGSIVFNSQMDALTLEWENGFQFENFKLAVLSRISGQSDWQDQTEIISTFSNNVQIEAPLILEFWNVLPAETPAQTLRYWDGAHSGPFGRRHGLKHLLAAAETNKIPLILLDLQNPQSLSALNYLEQKPYIESLVEKELLILPEYKNFSLDRTPGTNLGWESNLIIPSDFVFSNSLGTLTENFSAAFISTQSNNHLYDYVQKKLIPLPSDYFTNSGNNVNHNEFSEQINSAGLSLEVKEGLVNIALSKDANDLIVLGGNLRESPWGDPDFVSEAMNYINYHPWINVLDHYEILSHPALSIAELDTANCIDLLCTPIETGLYSNEYLETLFGYKYEISSRLDGLEKNPFSTLARENMLQLISYPVNLDYLALKLNYLNTIEPLIEASIWLQNPIEQQTCKKDFCILSSETLFFAFSKKDSSLIFAGSDINQNPVQWIASSACAAVGLSDSSDWQIINTQIIDPFVINGAFVESGTSEDFYNVYINDNGIIFKNQQNGVKKVYQISGNSLILTQTGIESQTQSIPIIFSELITISPGWEKNYFPQYSFSSDELLIRFGDNYQILIKTNNAEILSVDSFSDSYSWINEPENPDREIPDGHYLPFPLILVKIKNGGSFETSITFENN